MKILLTVVSFFLVVFHAQAGFVNVEPKEFDEWKSTAKTAATQAPFNACGAILFQQTGTDIIQAGGGATLIRPNVLITAKHVMNYMDRGKYSFTFSPVVDRVEPLSAEAVYQVRKVMGFKGQDIALILLDRDVTDVTPVQLMTDDEYAQRQSIAFCMPEMHYAGYGPDCSFAETRSVGKSALKSMLENNTGLLSRTVFEKTLGKLRFMVTPQELVTQMNPSMSTEERRPTMMLSNDLGHGLLFNMDKGLTIPVRGDSGSSTFVTDKEVPKLAGIVIKGDMDERMFREKTPGVYSHTLFSRLEDPYLSPGRLGRVLDALLKDVKS